MALEHADFLAGGGTADHRVSGGWRAASSGLPPCEARLQAIQVCGAALTFAKDSR